MLCYLARTADGELEVGQAPATLHRAVCLQDLQLVLRVADAGQCARCHRQAQGQAATKSGCVLLALLLPW